MRPACSTNSMTREISSAFFSLRVLMTCGRREMAVKTPAASPITWVPFMPLLCNFPAMVREGGRFPFPPCFRVFLCPPAGRPPAPTCITTTCLCGKPGHLHGWRGKRSKDLLPDIVRGRRSGQDPVLPSFIEKTAWKREVPKICQGLYLLPIDFRFYARTPLILPRFNI